MKENDYFLNILTNPEFTSRDFKQIGLTTENTDMQDIDTYKNLQFIQDNPMFQTDGKFDETKFNNAYNYALMSYNNFTNAQTAQDIASSFKFFRNNIWANNRQTGPEFEMVEVFNPLRQKEGIEEFGMISKPEFSVREIAETQESWDGKEWKESPNESFWDALIHPKALAIWEFDADEDGKPTSDPDRIVYRKGQKKLNNRGTYYYEDLNGKNSSGRDVLRVTDILTKDGSAINKYDFFDSDDIEKSTTGTLVRSVVKLAPFFIPGVNVYYTGVMAGLSAIEMFSKLGKMVAGYDNKFLNTVEAMSTATSFSMSDYDQGESETGIEAHPWSINNLITMGGDVFEQLAEQRWIFKYLPRVLGGSKLGMVDKPGVLTETQTKFVDDFIKTREKGLLKAIQDKIKTMLKTKVPTKLSALKDEYRVGSKLMADEAIQNAITKNAKIGEYASKIYMTGITVADSYNEAKEAGASDWSAALFTLGYALGEYGILSTDLGKWILPELRTERIKMRDAVKILTEFEQQEAKATTSAQKRLIGQKIIKFGKDVFNANYASPSTVKKSIIDTTKGAVANALGEGIEETVEEGLLDASRGLYNALAMLGGSDVRMQTNWQDENGDFNFSGGINDYALNFVGGVIGGGLGEWLPEFRAALKYNSYLNDPSLSKTEKRQAAYQELVGFIREGKKNQLLKIADKLTWGNPYLSAVKTTEGLNGEELYLPGNAMENQDLAVKTNFKNFVNEVENILNASLKGQSLSDDTFLDIQTGMPKELRFLALRNSATAAEWLQDYNTNLTNLVQKTLELQAVKRELRTNPDDEALNNRERQLQKSIKQSQEIIDEYTSGKASVRFKEQALFEMNTALSNNYLNTLFRQYAESETGEKYENIPENQLKTLRKSWDSQSAVIKKDRVRDAFNLFKAHNKILSEQLKRNGMSRIQDFNGFITKYAAANTYAQLQFLSNMDVSGILDVIQKYEQGVYDRGNTKENLYQAIIPYLFANNTALLTKYQSLLDSPMDTPEQIAERNDDIQAAIIEIFSNPDNLAEFSKMVDDATFIDPDTKQSINTVLSTIANGIIEDYPDFAMELFNITDKIESRLSTPMVQVADEFAENTGGIKLSELLEQTNKLYQELALGNNLSEYSIQNHLDQIRKAVSLLNNLEAAVVAARTDNISFEALAGYNATMNELNGNEELATIDKTVAQVMLQDIDRVKRQLAYLTSIYGYNQDQKLQVQTKLHHKNTIQFFNKAKRILTSIDRDKFEGYDELLSVLNGSIFLNSREGNDDYSLSLEERKQLEQERIQLYDALGTFINKNIDKLDDLLNNSNFNFFKSNDGSMSLTNTQEMDDSAFVWQLYVAAALKASNFYSNYKELINSETISIPAQESVVYSNIAFLTDTKGIFEKFRNSINKSVSEKIASLDDKSKSDLLTDEGIVAHDAENNDVSIAFTNMFLNEGDPGTGKTQAVDRITASYITKYHPELAEDMVVISNTKENAKALAEGLGAKHYFTMGEFMHTISPSYTLSQDESGNYMLNINQGTGQMEINSEKLKKIDGVWHYNDPVVEGGLGKPKLVFLDEVTLASVFELRKMDEWLRLVGAKGIVSGDFYQQGIEGQFVNPDGDNETYGLHRNMFGRTQKLGEAVRTNNSAKEINNKKVKAALPTLLKSHALDIKDPLDYYVDESGLYGDLIVHPDQKELVSSTLQTMLNTLGEGEKINFIYDDDTTDLYKEISRLNKAGKFAGKFTMMKASASQGGEGQYYIVEMSPKADDSELSAYFRRFYTAITRAKQGSMIMLNPVIAKAFSNSNLLSSKPSKFDFSESEKSRYSQGRKDILESVVGSVEKTEETVEKLPETTESSESSIDDGKEKDNIAAESKKTEKVPKVKNDDANQLNMFLHTSGTNELGCIVNGSNLTVSENWEQRIDLVNGLIKLGYLKVDRSGHILRTDGRKIDLKDIKLLLNAVQQIAICESSKTNIENLIKITLNNYGINVDDIKVRFAYKHSGRKNRDGKFSKDLENEKQYGILEGGGEKLTAPPRKGICVEIYTKSGDSDFELNLEVPVLMFTSPLTLLSTDGFKKFKVASETNPVKRLIAAKKKAEAAGNTNFVLAADELFLYKDDEDWISFFDDDFVPAKEFKVLPPAVSTTMRGTENTYSISGYDWENTWYTLSDLRQSQEHRYYSNQVFVSLNQDLRRADGTLVVPKGHQFILITDYNKDGITDDVLVKRFKDELANPSLTPTVSALLVSPPRLDLRMFFDNLNKVYKDDKPDAAVGTEFTILHLADAIFGRGKYEGTKFEVNGKSVLDWFKENLNADGKIDTRIAKVLEILDGAEKTKRDGNYTKETLAYLRQGKPASRKKIVTDFVRMIVSGTVSKSAISYDLTSDTSNTIENANKRIEALSELLKSKGVDGIFYHVKPQAGVEIGGLNVMQTSNDTFRGGDILVNVKPDTAMLVGDALPLLKQIRKNRDASMSEYANGVLPSTRTVSTLRDIFDTLDVDNVANLWDSKDSLFLEIKDALPEGSTKEDIIDYIGRRVYEDGYIRRGDKFVSFGELYFENQVSLIGGRIDEHTFIGKSLSGEWTIYKVNPDNTTETIPMHEGDTLGDGYILNNEGDLIDSDTKEKITVDNIYNFGFMGFTPNLVPRTETPNIEGLISESTLGQIIIDTVSKNGITLPVDAASLAEQFIYLRDNNYFALTTELEDAGISEDIIDQLMEADDITNCIIS